MTDNPKKPEERKPWQTPAVRVISPARNTRGGAVLQDQDDIWYTVS